MKAQTMNAGGTDQACSATAAGWKTIASRSGSAVHQEMVARMHLSAEQLEAPADPG